MTIDCLYYLKSGDKIQYVDMYGNLRTLIYIRNTGLVMALKDKQYSLQQLFLDEFNKMVHVPLNIWIYTGIVPRKV